MKLCSSKFATNTVIPLTLAVFPHAYGFHWHAYWSLNRKALFPHYQTILAILSTSDEIVAADVINAKAQELNYDPVKINQWVRNNIEYLPTWGSAQNAELTLEAKRGNAMDIASLTIALLKI